MSDFYSYNDSRLPLSLNSVSLGAMSLVHFLCRKKWKEFASIACLVVVGFAHGVLTTWHLCCHEVDSDVATTKHQFSLFLLKGRERSSLCMPARRKTRAKYERRVRVHNSHTVLYALCSLRFILPSKAIAREEFVRFCKVFDAGTLDMRPSVATRRRLPHAHPHGSGRSGSHDGGLDHLTG